MRTFNALELLAMTSVPINWMICCCCTVVLFLITLTCTAFFLNTFSFKLKNEYALNVNVKEPERFHLHVHVGFEITAQFLTVSVSKFMTETPMLRDTTYKRKIFHRQYFATLYERQDHH